MGSFSKNKNKTKKNWIKKRPTNHSVSQFCSILFTKSQTLECSWEPLKNKTTQRNTKNAQIYGRYWQIIVPFVLYSNTFRLYIFAFIFSLDLNESSLQEFYFVLVRPIYNTLIWSKISYVIYTVTFAPIWCGSFNHVLTMRRVKKILCIMRENAIKKCKHDNCTFISKR